MDGTAYYVMPFVDGESLRERLAREKQLSIADSLRIACEVASALDYAHRHGVIHRDIKPENIVLHDGASLVAGFGIALAVSVAGGTRLTQTGLSLGTPHYMSPEQAMGAASAKQVGPMEEQFARGEFAPLREWLGEHVHRHGMRWPAAALVARATGKAPDPGIWWRV